MTYGHGLVLAGTEIQRPTVLLSMGAGSTVIECMKT